MAYAPPECTLVCSAAMPGFSSKLQELRQVRHYQCMDGRLAWAIEVLQQDVLVIKSPTPKSILNQQLAWFLEGLYCGRYCFLAAM